MRAAVRCLLLGAMVLSPTVRAEREMTTDRPDSTESPFTVEPGRVQVEASLFEHTFDKRNPERDDTRVTVWNVMPVNVRIGLSQNWEMQVVVDDFVEVEVERRSLGLRERVRGFGDVTLRVKRNLWGNDGGESAVGVMPFVKIPTAADGLGNDSVEGGLILAFSGDLAGGWGIGAMTEADLVRNDEDDGYDAVWLNTVTVGRDLTERLGLFLEVTWEVGPGSPAGTFNAGCTYAVNKDLQLDAGINLGITRSAPDRVLFAGISKRF